MSRREFLKAAASLGASVSLGLVPSQTQTPEPRPVQTPPTPEGTPTPDPYEAIDAENKAQINSINIEGDFTLREPRIVAIGKLDLRFLPDVTFAILADHNGEFYAFARNVDECLIPQLEKGELLGTPKSIKPEGKFASFIRQIQVWPTYVRLKEMTASVMLNRATIEETVNFLEEDIPIHPLLTAKSATLNNQNNQCPTLSDKVSGRLGGILDSLGELSQSAQDKLSDLQWSQIIYELGANLGSTITGLEEGYEAGRSR